MPERDGVDIGHRPFRFWNLSVVFLIELAPGTYEPLEEGMPQSSKMVSHHAATLLDQMIAATIALHTLHTPAVIQAFRAIPRHLFVDQYYRFGKRRRLVHIDPQRPTIAQLKMIYRNEALTSHQSRGESISSISQPSLVALMLEALQLAPGMTILEIGAGTGWNAALMGYLVGKQGHVYSIDIDPDVTQRARRHLRRMGCSNTTVLTRDGGAGYSRAAPYDRLITTVGCPDVLPSWYQQLRSQGLLLMNLQVLPGYSGCLLIAVCKQANHLSGTVLGYTGFVTLKGAYGSALGAGTKTAQRVAQQIAGRRARKRPPLWPEWPAELKQRTIWPLLLFASLESLSLDLIPNGIVVWGAEPTNLCVLREDRIEVYGRHESYDRLLAAGQKWLDLGAPYLEDYEIEIWPKAAAQPQSQGTWLVQREYSQLLFRYPKRLQQPSDS